jgi:hypothetical protein
MNCRKKEKPVITGWLPENLHPVFKEQHLQPGIRYLTAGFL